MRCVLALSVSLLVALLAACSEQPAAPLAEALVAEADTVCPYSHATRGNIAVTLTVV